MTSCRRGSKAEHKELSRGCSRGNTVRCVHSRSLQLDILARRRCHHGDCSAFRSLELGKCHWPVQAALSGSIIKAPALPGDTYCVSRREGFEQMHRCPTRRASEQSVVRSTHHCLIAKRNLGACPFI